VKVLHRDIFASSEILVSKVCHSSVGLTSSCAVYKFLKKSRAILCISALSFVIWPSSFLNNLILFFFALLAAFWWKYYMFQSPLSQAILERWSPIISSLYKSSSIRFLTTMNSGWFAWGPRVPVVPSFS
jgi:hypothetical protein